MFIIYIFCLIHTNTYSLYPLILLYNNNIKIKNYVSVIRCNKDNMWKLKPKYRCEIFVAIFGRNFLTYNYLLEK